MGLFARIEKGLLVAMVLFVAGFALLQIILRDFFSTGIVWSDALLRHLVVWIGFLGAARATAENGHIRIDILPRLLPERLKRVVNLFCDAVAVVVCVVLCYASWIFFQDERAANSGALWIIPLWWLSFVFPLSFGLMAIRFAWRIVEGETEERSPVLP